MSSRHSRRRRRRIKAYITRAVFVIFVLAVLSAAVFGGIKAFNYFKGRMTAAVDTTTIKVSKSGKIKETIVEDFDENNYSPDRLQKMIDDEVTAYGTGVKAGKLKIRDGKAILPMEYADAKNYSSFNDEVFYCDTIEDLVTRGISFDADALASGGKNAVILSVSADVIVPSDIIYTSSNVTKSTDDPRKAAAASADGELAYIIY